MDKQDSVERGSSLFGQSMPFIQAFPMLASLKATVWIRTGGGMDENPQERHFALGNPPGEYIRCPKIGCTNGGWCIADVLRDMIAKRETHRKQGGICSGRQRMNRSMFRECLTHFMAEIELSYKREDTKNAV
ncbi:MAG TPA: hypothetical protein VIK59_07930 [Verrucomicrobiae bacterium]